MSEKNTTDWLTDRIESLKRHPVTASEYWTLLDDCKAAIASRDGEVVVLVDELVESTELLKRCREGLVKQANEIKELVDALREAIDEVEDWGAYASEYFQEKHDLSGKVAKLRAVWAKHTNQQEHDRGAD